jgi:hypothetical protein
MEIFLVNLHFNGFLFVTSSVVLECYINFKGYNASHLIFHNLIL